MADALRQLKIRTGVVNRLVKEEASYVKEAEQQQKHIDALIEKGEDEWTVNKQKEVLRESLAMIPDTQSRLNAAVSELELLLEQASESNADAPEVKAAREAIDKALEAQSKSQAAAAATTTSSS